MTHPTALDKAESLKRHIASLGCGPDDFQLAITKGEAYELLDYIAAGGFGYFLRHDLVVADINQAKLNGDPFALFAELHVLLGLKITSIAELH
jgi:hypothetical protein